MLQAATEEAVSRGSFGSPTVFVESGAVQAAREASGKEFMVFGSDRMEQLAWCKTLGRGAKLHRGAPAVRSGPTRTLSRGSVPSMDPQPIGKSLAASRITYSPAATSLMSL